MEFSIRKQIQNPQTEVCATKVALGFTGRVRVRYKRDTKESILNAHPDQRGETTNGRGDHTARRITGSTAPGATRNSARCGWLRPAATEAAPPEQKIKVRKPRQRSCDEKDAKGKLCAGHLKRWYDYPKEVQAKIGKDAEIYRCEFCKTLYKPDPKQMPHSFTLRY